MGLEIEYIEGQTPLDEDEKEGLLIESITTRGELDEFEQLNIEKAIQWTLGKKWKPEYIISEKFVKELHKRMFCEVWSWAGVFRKTNKNIGVDKYDIGVSLKHLLDDCLYWLENKTYSDEEFAIRFKYRIVTIHCFPNGLSSTTKCNSKSVCRDSGAGLESPYLSKTKMRCTYEKLQPTHAGTKIRDLHITFTGL